MNVAAVILTTITVVMLLITVAFILDAQWISDDRKRTRARKPSKGDPPLTRFGRWIRGRI